MSRPMLAVENHNAHESLKRSIASLAIACAYLEGKEEQKSHAAEADRLLGELAELFKKVLG